MSSPDFTGMPLTVGSVTGTRHFNVDALGRLRSPSQDFIWRPGENVASCVYCGSTAREDRLAHRLEQCEHGFYAFYEGVGDAYNGSTFGIIEGYGATTMGPRGFRASKAKVVALYVPDSGIHHRAPPLVGWWGSHLDDEDGAGFIILLCLSVIAILLGISGAIIETGWLSWACAAAAMIGAYIIATFAFAVTHEDQYGPESAYQRYRREGKRQSNRQLLEHNYPDVKIYSSRRKMLADYPRTKPELPTPETDEDFWTRTSW